MTPEQLFIEELLDLCEKHELALVPTFEMQISFHDTMAIVPFSDTVKKFIKDSFTQEDLNFEDDEDED